MTSHELEEAWINLLEVIFEDSTPEEIAIFAARLKEIPKYSREQKFARHFLREKGTHVRVFDPAPFPGGCTGFHWEEHTEEPVPLLELPKGLIQKGSNSWKITI